MLKTIKIIFYYENGDNDFSPVHFLFHTPSLIVCHSLGVSNMAIFDNDTKFIFSSVSDLQRIEDNRHDSLILE